MFLAVDRFELGGVGLLQLSDLGLDIRRTLGAARHVVADRAKEALEMAKNNYRFAIEIYNNNKKNLNLSERYRSRVYLNLSER